MASVSHSVEEWVEVERSDGFAGEEEGKDDVDLLKRLQQQNSLLERDRKSHTAIARVRAGSTPSISDSDSINSLRTAIINEEHVAIEEVMSLQSQCGEGRGGEGEGRGRGESDALVRLRTESEVSGGELTSPEQSRRLSGSKSPGEGGGDRDKQTEAEKEASEVSTKEEGEDLWMVWSTILKNWEESYKRNQKQIRQLARQGIPGPLRGIAWQLMCGTPDHELRDRYPALMTEVSPFERQIQRDLARTFPEHAFFKERDGLGQEALLNILKAYSVYDREVGYCQGSPFITGLLLMQKMPEEDAFCVFVHLMYDYKLRDLFKPSMADLGLCFFQLERLVEELYPSLYTHFLAVEFQTSMYASPWFLTMFASVLSLNVVFRIMDIFLVEGREIIFKVGLALLEHSQAKLMQLDMEDMLKHFQKEMKTMHEASPDTLMQKAQHIKINPRKMKRLEKDYQLRRERQAMENMELLRLQQSNIDLQKTVKSLEQECSSLADKLIKGQVSRAQEAEEMFIIRKELAKTRRKLLELEVKEATESNESLREESPKIVGGETAGGGDSGGGGGGRGDDGGEDGEEEEEKGEEGEVPFDCGPELMVLEDEELAEQLHVKSPDHVIRQEAEQVLRKLGVGTPGTSPRVSQDHAHSHTTLSTSSLPPPITEDGNNYHHDNTNNSNHDNRSGSKDSRGKANKMENNRADGIITLAALAKQPSTAKRRSSNSSDSAAAMAAELRKSREFADQLAQELVRTKVECAEAAVVFEKKQLEVRQAALRESQAVREVDAARSYISVLEQRLSESQMEKLACPHCSQKLGQDKKGSSGPADANSSEVLFSHLRAMWNSQAAATNGTGSPSRSRTPRFGPTWT